MFQTKVSKRKRLGKSVDVIPIPNLTEIQLQSYDLFLQRDLPSDQRSPDEGLEYVFQSTFPIESTDGSLVMEYLGYSFGVPKYTEEDAFKNDLTYSLPLKADLRIVYVETGEVREKEVYIAEIPLMTPRGTFIVNGAERVVVNQLHKSPGVVFSMDAKTDVSSAKIIPAKGTWLEFEIDSVKDLFHVKVDRKKGILLSTFLRILGYEKISDIIQLFYPLRTIKLNDSSDKDLFESGIHELRLAKDVVDESTHDLIFEAGQELLIQDIEKMVSFDIQSIVIIEPEALKESKTILNTIDADNVKTRADAFLKFYHYLRSAKAMNLEIAEETIQRLFFHPKLYNLGKVGRYKFNLKLFPDKKLEDSLQDMILSNEDIVAVIQYLLKVHRKEYPLDDIDHLGNRRVRCVGELLTNQLKMGFSRLERTIKERMSIEDISEITPQRLISIKSIMAVIKEFFGSSQLSQFMDQANPLSELTHKRRLNALGPGGLSRERASFEVRDVHYTHYGRICPIETPEGPNIGLILSLCIHAKINEYGFLTTPYRRVVDCKITDEIHYLTAMEEDRYHVAQANVILDSDKRIVEDIIISRKRGEFVFVRSSDVDYVDVDPSQIVSVSTCLIPFLEHNDANRVLMGSNMQRQAVPLMISQAPLVGTGIEERIAIDSGVCVLAKRQGEVIRVSAEEVHVKTNNEDNPVDIYNLVKYRRTNQNSSFNQMPIVKKGQTIEKAQVLADGPACEDGELALGHNVLVAFMSLEGCNYEDAIILSSRLVKENIFTSIHIDELEVEARETKLGAEKITKDIPNLSEEALVNLDEDGIIRIGARVESGSILVGKITPKAEVESTPEYKLLRSIFGEKAEEVRDTSLRVPNGISGTVIGITVLKRENGDDLMLGVEEVIRVYIAQKRPISIGDKMAGRHGNKGVVSFILPEEDMPFLADGTPVDVVLNPLGVPSRMNLGQILELQLGLVARRLNEKFTIPVFSGLKTSEFQEKVVEANLPITGKFDLYNGKTGDPFKNPVTLGVLYMLKLAHMVDDKVHARSTGPYSLVTQQPLGGKAQFGGQRLGEMEVWALEAYGAAYTLQEFLTVKSDDMIGRAKMYENIVRGQFGSAAGIPESFNVLMQELRGLCLDLEIYDDNGDLIGLTDKDIENINRLKNRF